MHWRVASDFVTALARDRFEAKKTLEASEDHYLWFIGYCVGLNHYIQLAKKRHSPQDTSFDVTSVGVSMTFDTLREMVDKCQAWFELKQWSRLQLVMRAFKELVCDTCHSPPLTHALNLDHQHCKHVREHRFRD